MRRSLKAGAVYARNLPVKKIFYIALMLLSLTSTIVPLQLNPARYVKSDLPLVVDYAKDSCIHGLVAGVAFHLAPYLYEGPRVGNCNVVCAGIIAAFLAKTCYENYNAEQEKTNCEAIAQRYNALTAHKITSHTGLRIPFALPVVEANQFKIQDESHRWGATLGGFTTGFLHADALCRCIAWACI